MSFGTDQRAFGSLPLLPTSSPPRLKSAFCASGFLWRGGSTRSSSSKAFGNGAGGVSNTHNFPRVGLITGRS